MGMKIGYVRVSSSGQELDVQLDRLADCDRIFSEKASAASAKNRTELQNALDKFQLNHGAGVKSVKIFKSLFFQ